MTRAFFSIVIAPAHLSGDGSIALLTVLLLHSIKIFFFFFWFYFQVQFSPLFPHFCRSFFFPSQTDGNICPRQLKNAALSQKLGRCKSLLPLRSFRPLGHVTGDMSLGGKNQACHHGPRTEIQHGGFISMSVQRDEFSLSS